MTDDITHLVHKGRGLVKHETGDEEKAVDGWPDVAGEAIRSINHLTTGAAIPPTVVYDVLGSLQGVGYRLPQALTQLSDGLARSRDQYEIQNRDADPAENLARASALLAQAAAHAKALGEILAAAQAAIAGHSHTSSAN